MRGGLLAARRSEAFGEHRRICLWLFIVVSLLTKSFSQEASSPPPDSLQVARSSLNAGRPAEAEKPLRDYLVQHPASADAHFLLGYTLFREQRAKDSLAAFTEGAKLRRPDAADLKIVAADYVLLGDFADADKWLSTVTDLAPNDAEAWYLLGRTKYNENHFDEAIASFQRVIELQPNDIRAEDNLGLSYHGLGQSEKAKVAYEAAIAWQKDLLLKDAQPYLNLGILLMEQGDARQAQSYLEQAAVLAPKNPRVHEELGRSYEELGLWSQAQHELEQAIALAPNASGLHFKLGQIYRRLGMQQQAEKEFDVCAKLNGSHSSIETPNPAQPN